MSELATLRLNISGPPGSIPAEAFMKALKHELAILHDLDVAISGNAKGSVYWVIDDLKIGSAICDIRSVPFAQSVDNGAEISRSILSAIKAVETENKTPAYISTTGMQNIKNLVEIPRHYKLLGDLSLVDPVDDSKVIITDAASEHLKELMPVKYRSKGSVEGRVEALNVHSKPKFTLYENRSNRAIACLFDYDTWIETVKGSLRQKVIVSGDLLANVRGETLRVNVKDIVAMKPPHKGLSIRDLDGIDPDFTGGEKSEEYVRRLRRA